MRLSKHQINEIKNHIRSGVKKSDIAKKYGVSQPAISYWSSKTREVRIKQVEKDYKSLYYKALAILVENRLIDVDLE